jgi:hypothetical protein
MRIAIPASGARRDVAGLVRENGTANNSDHNTWGTCLRQLSLYSKASQKCEHYSNNKKKCKYFVFHKNLFNFILRQYNRDGCQYR